MLLSLPPKVLELATEASSLLLEEAPPGCFALRWSYSAGTIAASVDNARRPGALRSNLFRRHLEECGASRFLHSQSIAAQLTVSKTGTRAAVMSLRSIHPTLCASMP